MTTSDPSTATTIGRQAAPDARRRRFKVAAMLLPVAAVVAIEGALRLAGFDWPLEGPPLRFFNQQGCEEHRLNAMMIPDPVLFWRLRPGWTSGTGDRISASGFRSEFEKTKAPGVRRVVCIGDSSTYGLFVPAASAWPSILGRSLAAAPGTGTWEVLNLGVPGYTSWQARRLLETDVERLAPDVVIAEVGGFNEWVPAVLRADREQGRPPWWKDLRVVEVLASAFGSRGHSLGADAARADQDRTSAEIADLDRQVKVRDSARDASELRTAEFRGERRVPLSDFEDDLRAIADWGAARSARVVFVVHPLPARTLANNPAAAEYADAVRRFAASRGLAAVEGPAAFRASGRSDAELFLDACHPTQAGHAAMASAVIETVAK